MHKIYPPDLKNEPLYGTTMAALFKIHDLIGQAVISYKKINDKTAMSTIFNVPHHMALIETNNHIVFALAPMPLTMTEVKILTNIKIDNPHVNDDMINHILMNGAGFQKTECIWSKKTVIINNAPQLKTLTNQATIEDAYALLDSPVFEPISAEIKRCATDYYDNCIIRNVLRKTNNV